MIKITKPNINPLTCESGALIDVYHWQSKGPAQGVIQILHGMSEHCLRYQESAEFLTDAGWHVVTHNHRGHGPKAAVLGDFNCSDAEEDGWDETVADAIAVSQSVQKQYKDLPLILLGHSMGSFMAQHCVIQTMSQSSSQPFYDGLILSGSNLPNQLQIKLLQSVLALEKLRVGADKPSALISTLSFGDFNKRVNGNRTESDWLSRDETEVDKYINDPLCGFECTVGFWKSFSQGLLHLSPKGIRHVDHRLPVYIISGTHDPVGNMGKGVIKLANMWRKNGNTVHMQLYSDARHELFKETNYLEVFNDLRQWLQDRENIC